MAHHLIAPLGGGVQPRLEINTLVNNDRFFSLYVQALSAYTLPLMSHQLSLLR